jgi:hypothetical protein
MANLEMAINKLNPDKNAVNPKTKPYGPDENAFQLK